MSKNEQTTEMKTSQFGGNLVPPCTNVAPLLDTISSLRTPLTLLRINNVKFGNKGEIPLLRYKCMIRALKKIKAKMYHELMLKSPGLSHLMPVWHNI